MLLLLVINPGKAACQKPKALLRSAFQNKILNRRIKNDIVKKSPKYQVFTVVEHELKLLLKWGQFLDVCQWYSWEKKFSNIFISEERTENKGWD